MGDGGGGGDCESEVGTRCVGEDDGDLSLSVPISYELGMGITRQIAVFGIG